MGHDLIDSTTRLARAATGGVSTTVDSALAQTYGMLKSDRFDYPKMWTNSGFSQSVTLTIRLLNPDAHSDSSYRYFIANPLLILMSLACPKSTSTNENDVNSGKFVEPFYIEADGGPLFHIKTGAITSLNIIKGGSENQFSLNQRPRIVEVKITIENLRNVLLISEGAGTKDWTSGNNNSSAIGFDPGGIYLAGAYKGSLTYNQKQNDSFVSVDNNTSAIKDNSNKTPTRNTGTGDTAVIPKDRDGGDKILPEGKK